MNIYSFFSYFVRNPVTGFKRNHTVKRIANLLINVIERKIKRARLISYPYKLLIDPTNICTLRCPLCPTGQRLEGRKKGKASFEIFRSALDQTGDYAYSLSLYSWGEPFLNSEIFGMIRYAQKEKRLNVHLSTTLQHFPEGYADRLVESGLEWLIVSLDGTTQETYEKYRIRGDFNKTIDGIKQIVSAKKRMNSPTPFVDVRFLVMKHNEHEIEAIRSLVKELKADHLEISPVMVNIKDDNEVENWLPKSEALSCYNYKKRKKKLQPKSCNWLWESASISENGLMYPCCHLYHESTNIGDLRQNSFREIWNNEKYQSARKFVGNPELSPQPAKTACEQCLKPFLTAGDKVDFINESITNKLKLDKINTSPL